MTGFSVPIHTVHHPLPLRRTSTSPFLPRRHGRPDQCPTTSSSFFAPRAKFELSELMGGRGLCKGEKGLQKELMTIPTSSSSSPDNSQQYSHSTTSASPSSLAGNDDAFEKELFGLTGGFPGGEKGLQKFIQLNPPPPPRRKKGADEEQPLGLVLSGSKPKPPVLPLFLPGMIVIVKNPKNPFHMYCGIVQRVTDGKVGVLFEGGNWDKLITFDLNELERRDKGPPMVNPKSPVLESLVQKLE